MDEQIRRLARYSIFGGLEEEELEWVAGALQVRRYDTGEEVVREISRRLRRVDEIAAEFLHASPADLPPVERG